MNTGRPSCSQSLLVLLGMVLLMHTSLQVTAFRAVAKSVKCPATPRPVNKSIKAAWDQTKKLETTLLTKTNVKSSDVCTYTNANDNNHKLGVALMRTSKIIYCFGLLKGKQFTREEFIDPVSEIIQARSEIMEDADVCVLDGDYKDVDCFTDISDLNDFNIMYEAVVEQIRLLEGLYIGTHKDD